LARLPQYIRTSGSKRRPRSPWSRSPRTGTRPRTQA